MSAPPGAAPRPPETRRGGACVSAVVPVYNGAATLAELVARLAAALGAGGCDYEIVLVNDASRDASWEEILRLAAADPRVRGVDLLRNVGQHAALLAGIRLARGSVIVTLDDDLQQPPEEIPKLLAALDAGCDVVYGVPRHARHSASRRLGSGVLRLLLAGMLGWRSARDLSALRAFRTEIRDAFADYRGSFVSIDALLTWGAERFGQVPVAHEARRQGRSNYGFGRLVRQAFDTVTTFSARPLKLASIVGFAFTVLGLAGMTYTVGFYKLRGLALPSDTFIFALVCMFSGIQLFTLGIIGEYLSRMHLRLLDRAPYAVRRDTAVGVSVEAEPGAGVDCAGSGPGERRRSARTP